MTRSRRVDFHRHVWPDELIAALRERTTPPLLAGDVLVTSEGRFAIDVDAHRPASCIAALDREDLELAIISLQPTLGIDALPAAEAAGLHDAYDAGAARLLEHGGGLLRPLAAGRPRDGFAGLCVAGRSLLDLDALAPLLDDLVARRQLLFVHPGPAVVNPGAPSWWAPAISYTAEMQAAYAQWLATGSARWPELPVVFAILAGGAPFQLERMRSRGIDTRDMTGANVLFETASYGRLSLELCLAAFGVDRIVYGSDAPVIDPRSTRSAVNALGKATADAIYRTNASTLLAA